MSNRILFRVRADENTISIQTYTPRIWHKLSKAPMLFNWPDADEIHLFNDFVLYSFFFREYRNGRLVVCGGLILHGQEDMSKAYYGIHT